MDKGVGYDEMSSKKALKGLVILFIEVVSEVFHSVFIISFETYILFHMAGLHPCRRPLKRNYLKGTLHLILLTLAMSKLFRNRFRNPLATVTCSTEPQIQWF